MDISVEKFLSDKEEQQVIDAIREAEKNTSGEIRVHLEKNMETDAMTRAKEVFFYLGMDKTTHKNGILFYVAADSHQFAVIGDEGIDKVVPADFWESIKNEVINQFIKGNHCKGLVMGILHAGEKLKEFYPYDNKDENELSDEISKRH
jgi:uncharacterized membrane protein